MVKKCEWVSWILVKAFDKVWHNKDSGLFKLERLGVRDPLLKWIKSYLTERKQCVLIDGQSSDWKEIDSNLELKDNTVIFEYVQQYIIGNLNAFFNFVIAVIFRCLINLVCVFLYICLELCKINVNVTICLSGLM